MKRIVTSLAFVIGLGSAAAFADGSALSSLDVSTLSSEQLESLTNILAGLPRQ